MRNGNRLMSNWILLLVLIDRFDGTWSIYLNVRQRWRSTLNVRRLNGHRCFRYWPKRTGTRFCTREWHERLRGRRSTSSFSWPSATTFSLIFSSPFSSKDSLRRYRLSLLPGSKIVRHAQKCIPGPDHRTSLQIAGDNLIVSHKRVQKLIYNQVC